MSSRIVLTDADMARVRTVAKRVAGRYRAGKVAHMRYGPVNGPRFEASLAAELAVSILTGEPWGEGDPFRPDVGHDTEVRWTDNRRPALRLYDPDEPGSQDKGKLGSRFVLVTGWPPVMVIHGHARGFTIRARGRPWRNPEGQLSYLLPIRELEPLGVHIHGWARDARQDWFCVGCGERYEGPVPVCERHPTGWQEAQPPPPLPSPIGV